MLSSAMRNNPRYKLFAGLQMLSRHVVVAVAGKYMASEPILAEFRRLIKLTVSVAV